MKFISIFISILYIFDIAAARRRPRPPLPRPPPPPPTPPPPNPLTNVYYHYNKIIDWCMEQALSVSADHPDWIIDKHIFGETVDGYNLTGIFVQFKRDQKIVVFEANIHGGESLASGVALYVYNAIIMTNSSSNPDDRTIIESYNWLIIPVANPDGYMFKRSDPFMFRKQTWKKSITNESELPTFVPDDVKKRGAAISLTNVTKIDSKKRAILMEHELNRRRRTIICFLDVIFPWCYPTTRRTTTSTTPRTTTTLPKRPCMGINPNLNFKYKFLTLGIITDNCEQNYPGMIAEIEPVTKYLAEYITENSQEIIMYISLHTNETRRIMVPFSNGDYCTNYNILKDLSHKAADFVRKRLRTKYSVGNIADLKELSSGHSVDFARNMGIKYAFMIETQDNKWQNAPPTFIPTRGREVMTVTVQLCKGVIREETRSPGQYKPVTEVTPLPSRQNKLHPESFVIIPIVLCLILYQIYHPILFA